MPARTVVRVEPLLAHVPVDRFEIVFGPTAGHCMEALEDLNLAMSEPYYTELDFTLTTAASRTHFRRTLRVASIFAVKDDCFTFTALFSGRIVSGVYNMKTRSGYFCLD